MNESLKFIPLLLLSGGVCFVLFLWAFHKFVRRFRKQDKKRDTAELMIRTVDDVVRGIRESETGLRDLYSKAEKKASFLERYHLSILESMSTGVLACNRQGQITAVNRSAERMLLLSGGGYRGRKLSDTLGSNNLFEQSLSKISEGVSVADRMELRIRRPGGSERWIELRTSVIRGKSGQAAGAVFLLDDVTERNLLRRRVQLQDRLAIMGEVSAGLAHEIRNAMQAVSGLAKLIGRRTAGDDRVEPLAAEIVRENEGLENTLSELLSFLKPQEIHSQQLDLGDLARTVLVPFEDQASGSEIEFVIEEDSDVGLVPGDRSLLTQALRNLIQNAVDSLYGKGEVRIACSAIEGEGRRAGEQGGYALLTVEDNGAGMDEETRRRIFAPFYTTKAEGTGLGLPMVQKAVAAHGGSIEVESCLGQGTKFVLYLPLLRSRWEAGGMPGSSAQSAGALDGSGNLSPASSERGGR